MAIEDEAAVESKGGSTSHVQKQQQRQLEQHHANDDTSITQVSLAAMSTCTATSTGAVDDISSMGGDASTTKHTSPGSRRKRKDDCSESRGTVASEDSARSCSRCVRNRCLDSSCHRWLERIDRTAATSNAPIRPIRSDDEDGPCLSASRSQAAMHKSALETDSILRFPQQYQYQLRTFSASLPRIEGQTRPILGASRNTSAQIRDGNSFNDADASAREVARRQSISLPPVRPTRTRDDSKVDLMASDDDDSDDSSSKDVSERHDTVTALQNATSNNEIDPYMFAWLLEGQQLAPGSNYPSSPSTPLIHQSGASASDNAAARSDPPKKPRRSSDADAYIEKYRSQSHNLMRFNTLAVTSDAHRYQLNAGSGRPSTPATNHAYRHHDRTVTRQEARPQTVSPKPPSKPSRTFDDCRLMDMENLSLPRPMPPCDLDTQTPRYLPRVSDSSLEEMDASGVAGCSRYRSDLAVPDGISKNHTSASSHMDFDLAEDDNEQALDTKCGNRTNEESERISSHNVATDAYEAAKVGVVVPQDESNANCMPEGSTEYDPDLFARLLHGENADDIVSTGTAPVIDAASELSPKFMESQPPPALVARVSSGVITSSQPAFNRFHNSAPCAMPEHIAGAVKSSHPPMRPRRSKDECMIAPDCLAAAAACVSHDNDSYLIPASRVHRPVVAVSGKRRASRRISRRSTLPLASDMPSAVGTTKGSLRVGNDAGYTTQDANLNAFSVEGMKANDMRSWLEEDSQCDTDAWKDRDSDHEHPIEDTGEEGVAGSYTSIIPARRRRRVVRRFTMPSKGRSLSPVTKKRRVVGRSVSCLNNAESAMTPAA